MKNVVFWDIKAQFLPQRRHITSPLQIPASYCCVRFEVFTVVTMKNVVFWDIKTQFLLHRSHILSSGMLRRVALVRTSVSEERNASIFRVPYGDKISRLHIYYRGITVTSLTTEGTYLWQRNTVLMAEQCVQLIAP
jgi:hypothetical protein